MDRTEFRFSRLSLYGPLFLCVLFLVVSLLFVVDPPELTGKQSERYSPGTIRLTSIFFAFIFFMASRSVYKQISSSKPALVLDSEGVRDNTSEFSQGLIRWPDIDHVSKQEVGRQKLICLHVKEPIDFSEKNVVLLTMARKATTLIDEDTINIEVQGLSVDFDTLFRQVTHYHKQSKVTGRLS